MIAIDRIGPGALSVIVAGKVGRAEVNATFDALLAAAGAGEPLDLLIDVRAPLDVAWWEALGAELARARDIPALLRAGRRIAVVADQAWVRVAARIEGALLPGVTYRSFSRARAAAARAWMLGDPPENNIS